MVLHGPIATNILNVYSAALATLSAGIKLSRTALALVVGIAGYLVTVYFIFAPSFAKAFDNWMISLLLWMSPWACVVLADFFIKRKGDIDVAALYASPETSAHGDINWSGIIAFFAGLVAGWSVEDGLVPALQGPVPPDCGVVERTSAGCSELLLPAVCTLLSVNEPSAHSLSMPAVPAADLNDVQNGA